jgi:nucleotide-binding universal stress UspA family protein
MFTKMIVPVDGSKPSDAALALALRLAADQHASMLLVHVVETAKLAAAFEPYGGSGGEVAIEAAYDAGRSMLREAAQAADRAGITNLSELVDGDCVKRIVAVAQSSKADLIVIGSHGRGGLARAVLGSVAEGVLRKASIPVLVTRENVVQ